VVEAGLSLVGEPRRLPPYSHRQYYAVTSPTDSPDCLPFQTSTVQSRCNRNVRQGPAHGRSDLPSHRHKSPSSKSCISPGSSSAVFSRQGLCLISDAVKQAKLVLFGRLPSRCVLVADMERPHTDINGRTGSVRSWDGSRGTFLVVVDTKRSQGGGRGAP